MFHVINSFNYGIKTSILYMVKGIFMFWWTVITLPLRIVFALVIGAPKDRILSLRTHRIAVDALLSETDFTVVVDGKKIEVHKNYMSMISPVFQAMFTHDMVESRTDKVNIKGFPFEVVKDVIGFCYGHPLRYTKTADDALHALVFADMYLISGVVNNLTSLLITQMNNDNFARIANHAWSYSSEPLKKSCRKYFRYHCIPIVCRWDFLRLDTEITDSLYGSTFSFFHNVIRAFFDGFESFRSYLESDED